MRLAASLYVAFLLALVALADFGVLGPLVRAIHALEGADKLAHALFALTLGALLDAAIRSPDLALGRVRLARAWAFAAPIVALEELSQLAFEGRTFDLVDLAADLVGLTLGVLAHRAFASRTTSTSPRAPKPS